MSGNIHHFLIVFFSKVLFAVEHVFDRIVAGSEIFLVGSKVNVMKGVENSTYIAFTNPLNVDAQLTSNTA